AARHGAHRPLGPVQPWPPHLAAVDDEGAGWAVLAREVADQPCSIPHTLAGVSGICSVRAACGLPARASASATAFTTLGVAPIVPSSPTPLTPSGLFADGTDSFMAVTKSPAMTSARGAA